MDAEAAPMTTQIADQDLDLDAELTDRLHQLDGLAGTRADVQVEVLNGHVALEVECVDRLYLNAYVPTLQVGPQVNRFLEGHLGNRIGSPALVEKIGNRFRREVKAFAGRHRIPILLLKKPDRTRWDDRKLDHVQPYLERAERTRRFGGVRWFV